MSQPVSFIDVVKARHSVRDFKPDPISDDVLKSIIQTASLAPSWCNSQPWAVTIATGDSLKQIREAFVKRASKEEKMVTDIPSLHRTDVSALSKECMEAFFATNASVPFAKEFLAAQAPIFNAPAVAYLTLPKGFSAYSVLDIGGFYQTLMLAAKAQGIDSIPAAATIMYTDTLHRVLGIPDDEQIIIGVALGYPTDIEMNKFVPERMPVDKFLTIKH